jgi:acyl carrier protein
MNTTETTNSAAVKNQVSAFIVKNFLFGNASKMPADSASLIESGIIDSTGILELIEFLESSFHIKVLENETIPANLDGIDNLVAFIDRKARAQ